MPVATAAALLASTGASGSVAAQAAFVLAAAVAAALADCRRRHPELEVWPQLAKYLAQAAAQTLLLWPLLAVLISAVLLAVVQVDEALGLPEAWLNPLVYWLVLYGPAGALCVLCRLRCARAVKDAAIPS